MDLSKALLYPFPRIPFCLLPPANILTTVGHNSCTFIYIPFALSFLLSYYILLLSLVTYMYGLNAGLDRQNFRYPVIIYLP
ncbi:hypothetical protein P168DRAFT_251731 [Aspergillus campestris IBT 28561]|uniref:Uncharacterized protein n=1 Tax=Aspergillus campestris (strain IBT 28561) TaxID=1392248 RepID=A0A2I1D4N4_ASPC2|nr:uncharacterized protein P168DRAFT_251731 [Aspergillus campestris IBT 28561]PKY04847.1 hypothetical protein P168DRAFT_251731 [Aspergillus campestris IBT 28561]